MLQKYIFFTLVFWVGLPQNLGFDFSVYLYLRDIACQLLTFITAATPLRMILSDPDSSRGLAL